VIGTSIGEVCQIWRNLMRLPQIRGLRWGWCKQKKSVRLEGEVWGQIFKNRSNFFILHADNKIYSLAPKNLKSEVFFKVFLRLDMKFDVLKKRGWGEVFFRFEGRVFFLGWCFSWPQTSQDCIEVPITGIG